MPRAEDVRAAHGWSNQPRALVGQLRGWMPGFRDPALEDEYQSSAARDGVRAYRFLFVAAFVLWAATALGVPLIAGSPGNLHAMHAVQVGTILPVLATVGLGWAPPRTFARWRRLAMAVGATLYLTQGALIVFLLPDPALCDLRPFLPAMAIVIACAPAGGALLGAPFRDEVAVIVATLAVDLSCFSRVPAVDFQITAYSCLLAATLGLMVAREIDIAKRREFVALSGVVAERKRSEDLLYNVLPEAIAERLKSDPARIAEHFEDATVMFADIAGFTPMSTSMAPGELVAILDEIFSALDELAQRHGLEKIKTIGDAYMVVGGVPTPRADHLEAAAKMALDMRELVAARRFPGDRTLAMRIGIHVGPVVAGVIGKKKLMYDLWGDTVNTASRMESHGEPGKVHVSDAVRERLKDRFAFEPRGTIDVKGKGPMSTWFLQRAVLSKDDREIEGPIEAVALPTVLR